MTELKSTETTRPGLDRSGYTRLVVIAVTLLLVGVILFLAAGHLDYWEGWAFLGLYTLAILANGLVSLARNPDVINERGKVGKNVKWWDKIITILFSIFFLAIMVVAGLDAGRYGWSKMALGWEICGAVLFVAALAVVGWAMVSNPFLATMVRVQTERGHYAVTTGPYRLVRHPMYVGTLLMALGMPLLLGSWYALIPGILIGVLFVIRTALEDHTLQHELPGYAEYALRVRYRLVPGLW